MKFKKVASFLIAIIVIAQVCMFNNVAAAGNRNVSGDIEVNIGGLSDETVISENVETLNSGKGRATNKFNWNVQPGTTSKASTAFSLESGETVEINCTFSPQKADVDFGLIAPNGRFYYAAGNDGNFKLTIQVKETGKYHFAVRNNSNEVVEVMGFVYY